MVKKEYIGSASIGVGVFLFAGGILTIVLTYLGITPSPVQGWILPWITNYVVGGMGIIIGGLLIGYGVHMRRLLGAYARRVEALKEMRAKQAQKLRQKTIALQRKEAELAETGEALELTRGELRESRQLARKKARQVYRVSGKLGDRTKRLKRIEEIARVRKRK